MPRKPDIGEPEWLHSYMMAWADALVRLAVDLGMDEPAAQTLSHATWRHVAAKYPEVPPPPGRLLVLAAERVARRQREAGKIRQSPQHFMFRLSEADRDTLLVALYGEGPFQDPATESPRATRELVEALARARKAFGASGPPPESATGWREWLASVHAPSGPAVRFDWAAWALNPGGAAAGCRPEPRPRWQKLAAGAVLLAAAVVVAAIRLSAPPPDPPTPFALAHNSHQVFILVQDKTPAYQDVFGGPPLPKVFALDMPGGVRQYQVPDLSRGNGRDGMSIGGLQFGVAERGMQSALVFYGRRPERVTLESGAAHALTPIVRGPYAVYPVHSPAATVKIRMGGNTLVMAWAPRASALGASGYYGGAIWPTAPAQRGFDGSYKFRVPPGTSVTPVGLLKSGLLAESGGQEYWLLPNQGPAFSLFSMAYTESSPLEALPYPGAADEVLVMAGTGTAVWWNLAADTWGSTYIQSTDTVLATPSGWVDATAGTDGVYSYGSPPVRYYMQNNLNGMVAWAHRVAVYRVVNGRMAGSGVYDWRTRRYVPSSVPVSAGGTEMVAFPAWGPTYLEFHAQETQSAALANRGPGTVTLIPADGGPSTTIPLSLGESFWAGPRWVVLLGGVAPEAGWPGPHGHFHWHVVSGPAALAAVTQGNGVLYWTTAHHVYVWIPPFARIRS